MKFRYPHEPFSPAAEFEPGRWADSPLFRQLTEDLRRFCCGAISGTSYLISGLRGSGKTTTVHHAIETVGAEIRSDSTGLLKQYARTISLPLFIPIHGPDLLPADDIVLASEHRDLKEEGHSPSPEKSNLVRELIGNKRSNEAPPSARVRYALKQLTRAIYRRLAEEISGRFSRLASDAELGHRIERRYGRLPTRRAQEWATKLQTELIHGVEISTLYAYWSRLGRADDGVVFAGSNIPPRSGQGLREIQALHAATLAYRNVSGKTRERLRRRDRNQRHREISRRFTISGSDLVKYASALLGIAGVAYGIIEKSGLLVAGSATAGLVGGLVATWNSKRRRSQTTDRDLQFTPDTSVAALDRLVPLLIRRIREAGLAPVFVVDEIDKIDSLDGGKDRLDAFLNQLKFMITGQGFFCCISGTGYYREIERQLAEDPQGPASTYFSHRVFLEIEPADLRAYAEQTIIAGDR